MLFLIWLAVTALISLNLYLLSEKPDSSKTTEYIHIWVDSNVIMIPFNREDDK